MTNYESDKVKSCIRTFKDKPFTAQELRLITRINRSIVSRTLYCLKKSKKISHIGGNKRDYIYKIVDSNF